MSFPQPSQTVDLGDIGAPVSADGYVRKWVSIGVSRNTGYILIYRIHTRALIQGETNSIGK